MVIAGVFLAITLDDILLLIIEYISLVCVFFYLIALATLLWSVFKSRWWNDIKSSIAPSTISQI